MIENQVAAEAGEAMVMKIARAAGERSGYPAGVICSMAMLRLFAEEMSHYGWWRYFCAITAFLFSVWRNSFPMRTAILRGREKVTGERER